MLTKEKINELMDRDINLLQIIFLKKIIICVSRRVHISEKTLSFLNGEFEVEPGYGERREEALKMASIKTFFIIKTIKPVMYIMYICIYINMTKYTQNIIILFSNSYIIM